MTTIEHHAAPSSLFTVERLASFADGNAGGNPAGVVICEVLPDVPTMQATAAEVGYSETAFAAPLSGAWRVRYFAPEIEVPFCGHATIALGGALARREGDGLFHLRLNNAEITVEGRRDGAALVAALQSPSTHSEPAPPDLVRDALALFGYMQGDLDPRGLCFNGERAHGLRSIFFVISRVLQLPIRKCVTRPAPCRFQRCR